MTNFLSLVFLSATFASCMALECNICGPGTNNIMLNPKGTFSITFDGEQFPTKQNCEKWQASKKITEHWCEQHILEYTKVACQCSTPDGTFLKDIPEPTASPQPTFAPLPTVNREDVAPILDPTRQNTEGNLTSGATEEIGKLILTGVAAMMLVVLHI